MAGDASALSDEEIGLLCRWGPRGLTTHPRKRWKNALESLERASKRNDRNGFECSRLLSEMYSQGAGVPVDPELSSSYRLRAIVITGKFENPMIRYTPENLWMMINRYVLLRKELSDFGLEILSDSEAFWKIRLPPGDDMLHWELGSLPLVISTLRFAFGSYHGFAEQFRNGEMVEPDEGMAEELDRLHIQQLKSDCREGNRSARRELITRYCQGDLVEKD